MLFDLETQHQISNTNMKPLHSPLCMHELLPLQPLYTQTRVPNLRVEQCCTATQVNCEEKNACLYNEPFLRSLLLCDLLGTLIVA
jgi:hypothetical protein